MSATPGADPIIRIDNVVKEFSGNVRAVDGVTLDIRQGEFFALLGPSGCGKTTLLRMLAGFEMPNEGQILIDGEDMSRVPPNLRPVNMVFQSYAVFPHMSVLDNVGYGLKVDGLAGSEIKSRAEEALEMVKLGGLGGRMPDQLSGGQRQRVALARALVKHPKVLLLDEPLSALDAKLREAMQIELVNLQERVGITFIIVTHDQEEALSMADRIAVMNAGKVLQIAGPSELYEVPTSRFVADFIGSVNLFEGKVASVEGDGIAVNAAGANIQVALSGNVSAGAEVAVAVRPEKISMTAVETPSSGNGFGGTIEEITYRGDNSTYHVKVDAFPDQLVKVTLSNANRATERPFTWEDRVILSWQPGDGVVLTA